MRRSVCSCPRSDARNIVILSEICSGTAAFMGNGPPLSVAFYQMVLNICAVVYRKRRECTLNAVHGVEPMCMAFGVRVTYVGPENMDAMELDMRMRLAELQARYREKQRELARLQRRTSSE